MLNKQVFEMVFNHTLDGMFIVDQNRHLVYATPSMMNMSGYEFEEVANRDMFFFVHPEDKEYMLQRHKNLLASKQKNATEYRIIKKSGEIRHFECRTTPLPDTENYLQVVTVRDITDRKLMEIELEKRKNRYEVLQKSLRNFSKDLSLVMKLSDLEERLSREIQTILPDSEPRLLLLTKEETLSLKVGRLEIRSDEILIKIGERNQSSYILRLNSSAIQEQMDSIWLETLSHYTVMVFENLNIIENLMEQLESAVAKKETPRWVLRLLFNLQEQQRLTLSSDLHDTVLQDQIDLYRRLEALLKRMDLDQDSKSKLKEIEQGMLDIVHEIRMTCNELRPPLLRELGLERALENLFEHIQVTSTYKIDFYSNSVPPLTEELTIGIYRIIQELLINAENHARASKLQIRIDCMDGLFKLEYQDDGVGFDAINLNPSFNSMGLTSMMQRAESLGGNIGFDSKPGLGLKVILELPIIEEVR